MLQAALTSIVFEATRQGTVVPQTPVVNGDGRLPRLSILWVYGAMVAMLKIGRVGSRRVAQPTRMVACGA